MKEGLRPDWMDCHEFAASPVVKSRMRKEDDEKDEDDENLPSTSPIRLAGA